MAFDSADTDALATAPSRPQEQFAPVDFGTRFSAFMIDTTLLFVAQWVVFMVLSRQLQAAGLTSVEPCTPGQAALCEGPSTGLWALLLMVLLVSTVGYHVWFEGRLGATPGKRWLGLAVATVNGSAPIGFAPALIRAVVKQAFWLSLLFLLEPSPLAIDVPAPIFVLVPALAAAGVVLGALVPDGRAVHDLAAGTVVLRRADLPVAATMAEPAEPSTPAERPEEP